MRFGLSMGVSAREPVHHAVEVLSAAESYGVDCAWLIDSQLIMKDVYVTMALAFAATSRIGLGTGVTNPITRHLTVTANAVATLQEVSGGRVLVGLGAGDSSIEPLGLPAAKLKDCEFALRSLRGLLSGEEVSFGERPVRLATARGPAPLYLAASQPGMLRLAGRCADGVIVMGLAEPEMSQAQIDLVRQGAREAGRDPAEIAIDLWVTLSASEDVERAVEDVRSWCASQARWISRWQDLPRSLVPFAEEIRAAAAAYDFREHLSLHAQHRATVSDAFCRRAAIAGDADYCVGRLRELASLDLHRITVTLLSGGRRERLRVLGERILPRVG